MTTMLDLPEALEAAGVNVRVLDGWDTPAQSRYVWREDSGDPAGHMHHHTASSSYVPNRDKANGYAGLSKDGSDRLYQEDYGDGQFVPVYTIANAYPAPISSGAGDRSVLERVRAGIEVVGRQGSDTPGWYGNTHYWNTEWVLNGIGALIDERVWEMMCVVCQVQNELMDWTKFMHIGHYHHTRRKIDLYDGRDQNADETIQRLRADMEGNVYAQFVAGIVTGWAEDKVKTRAEFERLMALNPPLMGGDINYWMGLLDDPTNKEWLGFYARTELSSWGA